MKTDEEIKALAESRLQSMPTIGSSGEDFYNYILTHMVSMYKQALSDMQVEHPEPVKNKEVNTSALDELLSPYGPFPLHEILKYLIDATDILLHNHGYDGHGWEGIEYAWRHAKEKYPFANEALVQYLQLKPHLQPAPESDAVAFGEWIQRQVDNDDLSIMGNQGYWYYYDGTKNKKMTSAELYQEFKNHKQQ